MRRSYRESKRKKKSERKREGEMASATAVQRERWLQNNAAFALLLL